MTSATRKGSLPLLPESLLVPLLDSAADVLQELESADVPASLRPVAGFDRRGLSRGAARQQLLRAIDTDEAFQDRTVERFTERPEVTTALKTWDPYNTFDIVEDAAEHADLPLLASMLYSTRPRGWMFGLGVVCATYEWQRLDREKSDDRKAWETRIAGISESRRRAEAALAAAEERAEHLEAELREERQGRRDREAGAAQTAAAAERKAETIERELEDARASLEAAEARVRREAGRARTAEEQLRDVQRTHGASGAGRESSEPVASAGLPVLRAEDLRALVDAAELAQRLADGLSGVAEQARRVVLPDAEGESARRVVSPEAGARERGGRRAQARVPPGMVEDDPEVLEAMLRASRAMLVVDGYNVSMLAWGNVSPAEQRERLVAALAELRLRTRAQVTVVFDGADIEGVRPPQRRGVRVVFSPAGEEADAVVVREVTELPTDVPVIVASSDNWVAEHARKADARVVSSSTLLRALRR
jgi:predicted RNA-binding protein with PIN domain